MLECVYLIGPLLSFMYIFCSLLLSLLTQFLLFVFCNTREKFHTAAYPCVSGKSYIVTCLEYGTVEHQQSQAVAKALITSSQNTQGVSIPPDMMSDITACDVFH